ncbi:thioredoxin family protein [Paenibacillus ottowii]
MQQHLQKRYFKHIHSALTSIDFWAFSSWPCKAHLQIKEGSVETFAKVNIDNETELASPFDIRSIPTLLLFKNGKEMACLSQKHILKVKILKLAKK